MAYATVAYKVNSGHIQLLGNFLTDGHVDRYCHDIKMMHT